MLPDSPVSAALMQTMRELAALESAVEQTGEDVLPERIATRLLGQTGKLGQALTDRAAQIQTLTIDGADAPGLTAMFDIEMRQYEQARNAIRDAQAAFTELVAAPPGVRASFGRVDSRFRMLGKSARRLRAIEYRLVPAVRD